MGRKTRASKILVFDTETSGATPQRLVQFAGTLLDADLQTIGGISVYVKSEGHTFTAGAVRVHGITEEMADARGVSMRVALRMIRGFVSSARLLVAHNLSFDESVLKSNYEEAGLPCPIKPRHVRLCTMHASTDICQIPHKFTPRNPGDKWKWPRLEEAHRTLLGKEMDGAHDAAADVRATVRVLRCLVTEHQVCADAWGA